jgi:hypothetical protein
MTFGTSKTLVHLLGISLIASALAHAQCPVDSVTIKGRVEHLPRNASVRVQLVYPKDQRGESTEAILDGATFTIPVEFVTTDRRTTMNFNPRCEHKPRTVVVTLQESAASTESVREYDHISLDFPHDFKTDDSQHYTVRSEVVLDGQQP